LQKTELIEELAEAVSSRLFIRSMSVVSRRVAGETLIVPVRGKVGDLASIYSFNETGSLIWQALESPKSLADLIDAIEQEYSVAREQAEKDVVQFLSDTLSVGLVEDHAETSMAARGPTLQGKLPSNVSMS
jgi:hypothetical protein